MVEKVEAVEKVEVVEMVECVVSFGLSKWVCSIVHAGWVAL